MNNKIITLFTICFALFSCQDAGNIETEAVNHKVDSLQALLDERDNTVNEFFETFNEIENNLAKIKEKENIITVNTTTGTELNSDIKDRINDDIVIIYNLLQENKQKLNNLNDKLKRSNLKITELNKMIERLTDEINNRDAEISKLKEELTILNILVEDLTAGIDTLSLKTRIQEDIIEEQDETINTAFYVFGTKKELKENNVITKEGGFIGIGAVEKLLENFDKDYFTKIDIRKTNRIPLACKKAKIVTTHPADSYKFDENNENINSLIIEDYKKFWSISKYLVIVIEQ